MKSLRNAITRRFSRTRRRQKIGRAYDMALEIAPVLPSSAQVLDVGCGNGFIAHHLNAMLDSKVVGLDIGASTAAPIEYFTFDGRHFPVADRSFDAVLLCYVLHHAQDARLVLDEASRALRQGGLAVVYEDIPRDKLDRAICWFHNRQWQRKTGPCTFLTEQCWRESFVDAGFQVVSERSLSRWRNFAHPVSRRLFVLKSMDVERASHRRRQSVSGTAMISEETYARV